MSASLALLADHRMRKTAREALVAYGPRILGTLRDHLTDPQVPMAIRRAIPKVIMEPGSDQEQVLLKVNHSPIASGTRFRAFTGGGGGYGPPWERDVGRVQADVIDGYVSRAAAADEYGVYFEGDSYEVDEARTQEARAQLAREKP